MHEGAITVASALTQNLQIVHLCVDPSYKERHERGIATNIGLDLMSQFGDEYPEICLWPREPSSKNLPQKVWEEYFKRIEESYRQREQIWLEKIVSLNKWPLLFICGANHFDPFSELLKHNNIRVVALDKDWAPK